MDLANLTHIDLPATADFHCHLRQDEMMELCTPLIKAGGCDVVFVMPNTQPPITQVSQAVSYHQSLSQIAPDVKFLMSLYLHPSVNVDTIATAARSKIIYGVTTNSQDGVLSIESYYPIFEAMQAHDLVLNLHGETAGISALTAEAEFIPQLQKIHNTFPRLRIVLEHVSTREGIEAVRKCGPTVKATITAHHLWVTTDDAEQDVFSFCKPIAKTTEDRVALLQAAVDGSSKFFFGSDSAPHPVQSKTQSAGAAGCFTQGWCTALVIGALEHALRQGWISQDQVTQEALEGFLSKYGRVFYNIGDANDEASYKPQIRLTRRGETIPKSIKSSDGQIEVVPFRSGQEVMSLKEHDPMRPRLYERGTTDGPHKGDAGCGTTPMSAAEDTTDAGPDLSINDAESDLADGKDDEEVPTYDDEVLGQTDTVAGELDETSSSGARDGEEHNNARFDHLASAQIRRDPATYRRPSSADGSLSTPDDSPSLKGSVASSTSRQARLSAYGWSPTPSLRPFDRRFQARLSSPQHSSRAASPAFLHSHSRTTSANGQLVQKGEHIEPDQAPWEIVRWTRLRKISGAAFSEVGKRSFGRPICIAISTTIALGTSKGLILVFDYNQNLKSIIGSGTKAVESGAVTSISISADHSTVAGGHASGHIYTWELAKPAKPFLHIPPVDKRLSPDADGHSNDVAVLHLGFLGSRHTALVSADDKGMAFSHLATRGMGIVARTVKSTRILGRYPEHTPSTVRQRKPSSVLAFSPLPLGNAEQASDTMGLVAMLTPYLLVIVSTTPIAQTQYKTPRPKEVAAHSAMTAALAWFPSVKLKVPNKATSETSSKVKLVYCWSNVLTVLEVVEIEPSSSSGGEGPPNLQFRPRSKWKAQEAIVAVQWLGRSVLAVLTITQQLVVLEDSSLRETNSSDLVQKHMYHADLFSQQLNMLVEELDEEDASMHGVVADAFYMSFRAYKGRLFLLGFNELSFGQLSNWADRLLALMEEGNYIGAIELAVSYYTGEADKVSVGLPDDDDTRHRMVLDKLLEMISASLRYTFGKHGEANGEAPGLSQFQELAGACISACVSIEDMHFLFDEVYPWFSEADIQNTFFQVLEPFIMDDDVQLIPPIVIKDLVSFYTEQDLHTRLEEMLCHLDPRTMDLDQINSLCKRYRLYDALLYVWNQALDDYTTILNDLLGLTKNLSTGEADAEPSTKAQDLSDASKIFPYLSYILTSRVYPTGKEMDEGRAALAKAEIYNYFFPGSSNSLPNGSHSERHGYNSFPDLRKVLDFDAPSFLSMLNEAFEDSFLDGTHDHITNDNPNQLLEGQNVRLSVKRQWIVSILLGIMVPPRYEPEDTVYLHMFIARNLPKFPQFVLLPGHTLHQILQGLCEYSAEDISEDCQLSVEYLLSVYWPPDVHSLIPLLTKAGFFRVLRSIYRSENDYGKLLQTCFDEGPTNGDLVFDCVAECLRASTGLNDKQVDEVRNVIEVNASLFVERDVKEAAATIERYAPNMHETMLDALTKVSDDNLTLEYLRTILDPVDQALEKSQPSIRNSNRTFVELYVRLLCEQDPHHVNGYIERLKAGDLRLEEVLPALESSGVVDAAVILMAREGRVREAIGRLTQHLDTLEAALLGLLDAASESPDVENTTETAYDLVASIQKFARVGIWLCQEQTRSLNQGKLQLKHGKRSKSEHAGLSTIETLWLDLIDSVVKVTKQITESMQLSAVSDEANSKAGGKSSSKEPFDTPRLTAELRTIVQETFTALLSATSVPRDKEALRADVSFLRILRAFLKHASASSPSLANLRSVLSTIFSAYSYEESLLALANRLLDKDVFVHVEEADKLSRRGWRPLGQVCEGCGRRVWGPGTGGAVWEAWLERDEEIAERVLQRHGPNVLHDDAENRKHGKGKATLEEAQRGSVSGAMAHKGKQAVAHNEDGETVEANKEASSSLIIFSCRHIFHRICLEKMQEVGEAAENERRDGSQGGQDFRCPLCVSI
ncbi:MAG: hypothetical protein Q9216_005984 [Gyalolechia sp. 2 TL-2023]